MPRCSLVLALALSVPAPARGDPGGVPPPWRTPDLTARPALVAALARQQKQGQQKPASGEPAEEKPAGEKAPEGEAGKEPAGEKPAQPSDLDFDLLGEARPEQPAPDAEAMRRRRAILGAHQAVGLGLYPLTLGTVIVGQLNYRDKFSTGANTEKYAMPHKVLAYSTAGLFALQAGLALAAPAPVKHQWRWDRASVHRVAMLVSTLGMITQVGLEIYTASREGYVNQQDLAKAHLWVGWGTVAAMTTGVVVFVF